MNTRAAGRGTTTAGIAATTDAVTTVAAAGERGRQGTTRGVIYQPGYTLTKSGTFPENRTTSVSRSLTGSSTVPFHRGGRCFVRLPLSRSLTGSSTVPVHREGGSRQRMSGPSTMSHPALWTCPACGRPLTVALNPEGGEAGAHRPLEISRASAAAHACAPAARFPQFHSASSSITGYEPASGQPWQPPVSAGAEDDEGVLSQSEYTLTKPSSCPNHRDHVTAPGSRWSTQVWTGLLALVVCAPLAGQEPATRPVPASNVRMAQRLEALAAARLSTLENDRDNLARLEALRAMPPFTEPGDQLIYQASVAGELLRGGRTEEAIAELERLHGRLQVDDGDVPSHLPAFPTEMRRSLAIAYARLAQQENCLRQKAARRCAVPLDEETIHPSRDAAHQAIALYETMAEESPDDMVVRWMLNLAYMWIGEHPDGVPPAWLIPPSAYGSSTGVAAFVDVAPKLGLDVVGLAGGSVMEDFDADGDLDVMASSWGLRDQLRYMRNNGDGTFDDATLAAGLQGISRGLNLVSADYDNDGFVDVLLLRGAWTKNPVPNSLLRSNGDGSFTDVTEAAGLLRAAPTQTAVWGDYDNDGDVDLFVGNESLPGSTYPSELFANNGDGTFTDVAPQAGVQVVGFVKGTAWGDVDNDGRLDLFVSRLGEPNLLFRNAGPGPEGRWTFRDVTVAAGVEEPRNSFPTWFFDYDNDGWLDLFVAGYLTFLGDVAAEAIGRPLLVGQGYPLLYRNRGDGTFVDVTEAVGLHTIMPVMGSNFGDLDNDGFLDIYLGTGAPGLEMLVPNRVFRNVGGERFENVSPAGGFGHLQKGHGVSFGDIDHDGDQDVYMVLGGAYQGDVSRNVLLLNPGHGNAWITLRFQGTTSNRLAIGARIRVTVATPDGDRVVHATAGTGGSFGASTLQQEIGLGSATTIRELTVEWPGSGLRDTYRDVPINRVVLLRQGDPAVTPLPVDPLDLGSPH